MIHQMVGLRANCIWGEYQHRQHLLMGQQQSLFALQQATGLHNLSIAALASVCPYCGRRESVKSGHTCSGCGYGGKR